MTNVFELAFFYLLLLKFFYNPNNFDIFYSFNTAKLSRVKGTFCSTTHFVHTIRVLISVGFQLLRKLVRNIEERIQSQDAVR